MKKSIFEQFDKVARDVVHSIPSSVADLNNEVRSNLRTALSTALSNMDIPTRDEVSTQQTLLKRALERIDEMQQRIEKLENQSSNPPQT